MAVLSKVANIAVAPTPVGVVEAFAGTNAPNGWLICDGSQVSRSLYPELFSVIGTTYGSGDGFSTFTLPDLRGRTIAGKDGVNNMNNGPTNRLTSTHFGASGTALGNSGGSESNTLSTAQMPSHTHTQDAHSHQVRVNSFAGDRQIACGPLGADGDKYSFTDSGNDASTSTALLYAASSTGTNQNTGGGGAHNNTQPTIILNYIIKAVSELPRGGWYNSSSPDLVTSLPTNPYVGQEVYHLVSGLIYFKRYNGSTWDEVSVNSSSLPSGTILQQNYSFTSTEVSTTSGSRIYIGLSGTIVPKRSNSKIIVDCSIQIRRPSGSNTGGGFAIYRNGNSVYSQTNNYYVYSSTDNSLGLAVPLVYEDLPATTSSCTYTVYGAQYNSTTAIDFQDDSSYRSTMVLTEVAV